MGSLLPLLSLPASLPTCDLCQNKKNKSLKKEKKRNATDFCALILYPDTLLNCYTRSSSFGVESFGFSTNSIISSAKSDSLTSYLLIWMPLISFCCLIAEARTSSTMLNSSKPGFFKRVISTVYFLYEFQ